MVVGTSSTLTSVREKFRINILKAVFVYNSLRAFLQKTRKVRSQTRCDNINDAPLSYRFESAIHDADLLPCELCLPAQILQCDRYRFGHACRLQLVDHLLDGAARWCRHFGVLVVSIGEGFQPGDRRQLFKRTRRAQWLWRPSFSRYCKLKKAEWSCGLV